MNDPKVFTGPAGYQFQILPADEHGAAALRIAPPEERLDIAESFPLSELAAFLAHPETAAAFEAIAAKEPIDFKAGAFSTPATWADVPRPPRTPGVVTRTTGDFVPKPPTPRPLPPCSCGSDSDCRNALCSCKSVECGCPRAAWFHANDY